MFGSGQDQGLHLGDRTFETDEQRMRHQRMADVQLVDALDRRHRLDVVVMQAMAGVDDQAVLQTAVDPVADARQLAGGLLEHDGRGSPVFRRVQGRLQQPQLGHHGLVVAPGVQGDRRATEALHLYEDLIMLPCYHWNRSVIVPKGHPLTQVGKLSIADIARFPLVTYVFGFTGRSELDLAFNRAGFEPNIVFTATDADVIKTYVRLGLGVGIVAEMAVKDDLAGDLVARPLGDLLGKNVSRVAFKRGAYLRNFVYQFAELLSDRLTTALVAKAMTGHVNDYEL